MIYINKIVPISYMISMILIEVYCKEYERAVIFRLGRLLSGGARGPGVFFIIPCVDIYEKVDMRTQTFDVPPQEVSAGIFIFSSLLSSALTSTFQVWLR